MKFRIVEYKSTYFRCFDSDNLTIRTVYKPQYKEGGWFSTWRNIADDEFFSEKIYTSVFLSDGSVLSLDSAKEIIELFKEYLEVKKNTKIIHKID